MTIPTITTVYLLISMALCFAVPIGYMLYVSKFAKMQIRAVFIGIFMFVLSSMFLEQMCHSFFLGDNAIGDFINGNPFIYALYGCLMAGLFEEIARFIAMKYVIASPKSPGLALQYGIGHGAVECTMIGGLTMVSNLMLVSNIKSMGYDAFAESLGDTELSSLETAMDVFVNDPGSCLVGGYERVVAFAAQIAFSVMVFQAVKAGGSIKYLIFAILGHMCMDFPAGLYQAGVLKNVLLTEGLITLVTVAFVLIAYSLYRKNLSEFGGHIAVE